MARPRRSTQHNGHHVDVQCHGRTSVEEEEHTGAPCNPDTHGTWQRCALSPISASGLPRRKPPHPVPRTTSLVLPPAAAFADKYRSSTFLPISLVATRPEARSDNSIWPLFFSSFSTHPNRRGKPTKLVYCRVERRRCGGGQIIYVQNFTATNLVLSTFRHPCGVFSVPDSLGSISQLSVARSQKSFWIGRYAQGNASGLNR